jgi:S1-C subfamily serine protease
MMQLRNLCTAIATTLLIGCGGGGGSESTGDSCGAFKVFNGDECTNDSLPVVQLTVNGQGSCTGTIVSEDVVLTAAHCVVGASSLVASHDRGEQAATAAIANPLFGSGAGAAFDIGVARFPGIASNLGVRPAQFGLSRSVQIGDKLNVIGYGTDGTPALVNGNPRGASVTVQGSERGLIVTLFDADGEGTCFGDSGGAATYDGKIVATVQGGGSSCGAGNTNTFVNLALQGNYSFLRSVIPEVPLG